MVFECSKALNSNSENRKDRQVNKLGKQNVEKAVKVSELSIFQIDFSY